MKKKVLVIVLAICAIFSLAGCSGVSQEKYDNLKSNYDIVASELEELKSQQTDADMPTQTLQEPQNTESQSEPSLTQTPQASEDVEKLLFENDDIVISYLGFEAQSKHTWKNAFGISIKIKNKSNRDLSVQTRDLSVNDVMSGNTLSSISTRVLAGKTAFDEIEIEWEDITISSIDEIQNIELKFHIFGDDMDDRSDSDVIKISPDL